MKIKVFTLLLIWTAALMDVAAMGEKEVAEVEELQDTLHEVVVTMSLKENGALRRQPSSVSSVGMEQMRAMGASGIKDFASAMPNVFIPDYGSHQTNAIYVRGIGSRIGTPAVGMYVDDAPYYSSSAFDFNMFDVEGVDVLRGPQSTLYGRNTMGGLIKIRTRNPFEYEGTDVRLGFTFGNHHNGAQRRASVSHYHRVSDRFAFSAGGFYEWRGGFFRNAMTGRHADGGQSAGGRMRAIWKANDFLTFDANVGFQHVNEGAYPYYYTGAINGEEKYEDYLGRITANHEGRYRRNMVSASIKTQYRRERFTLSSVTAYQGINDRMFMDQDFMYTDIYTLEQQQQIHTLSEELLLKNDFCSWWKPLTGVNVYYQWQKIQAPVNFRKDGVAFLNDTIASKMKVAPMPMSVRILGDDLLFNTDFSTPTLGAAVFHQSTFKVADTGLSFNVGLRLDYEKNWMRYSADATFSHNFMMPMLGMRKVHDVANPFNDSMSNDYLQFLPKVTANYDFGFGNVYASVGRGYRSGGYNAQGFSEVMRTEMMRSTIANVRDDVAPMLPPMAKGKVLGILDRVAGEPANVQDVCAYDPEYAWNYEVGTHLDFFNKKLVIDVSAFWSDVSNLQLSQMSETGLGRIVVNADKSRSVGAEFAFSARPFDRLVMSGSYGYTRSTFRQHDVDGVNINGNYVPYMPQHTFNVDVAYMLFKNSKPSDKFFNFRNFTVGVNCSGAGRIYWDVLNSHSQSLYALLGVNAKLAFRGFDLQFWGRNLTNTAYSTFWFASMERGYEQYGKPIHGGVDLKIHF